MARLLASAVLCAAAALGLPAAAGAATVATGPEGRALMTWTNDAGVQVIERTPGGAFTAPRTIGPPSAFATFAWAGPGSAATVLASDVSPTTQQLLLISRPDGAPTFAAPAGFGAGTGLHVLAGAANARGDAAVVVRPGAGNLVLMTAVAGGPLGSPREIPAATETATVAVGADGQVLVAWYAFGGPVGVRAQRGGVASPLGPVRTLRGVNDFSDVRAALDDEGTATVAYVRTYRRNLGRRAELVVRRARAGGDFGAARVVARGGPPTMGAGFADFRLAAAGRTTALAFDANDADGRLGVAIARGAGAFAPAQRPTPGSQSFVRQPFSPSVAVDRAGDVLLAYTYGVYDNAVSLTERRAGAARFTSPRVISTLGHGGGPTAALLSDRKRLVAWNDRAGALHYRTRLAGRRPDLSPPDVTVALLRGTEASLRASNRFGVRVRCSEACVVTGRATLRTPTGRTILGAGYAVLRAGAPFVKRYAFDPTRRAGRARDGSILRVTVDVENSSGASRERVVQIRLR